MVNGLFKGLSH